MKQLQVKDILSLIQALGKDYSTEELLTLPVYIGDDDELNGVHCAWYAEMIDSKSTDLDQEFIIELINERAGNFPLEGKAILIS